MGEKGTMARSKPSRVSSDRLTERAAEAFDRRERAGRLGGALARLAGELADARREIAALKRENASLRRELASVGDAERTRAQRKGALDARIGGRA